MSNDWCKYIERKAHDNNVKLQVLFCNDAGFNQEEMQFSSYNLLRKIKSIEIVLEIQRNVNWSKNYKKTCD